jgi:DNA-binding beta-propeller fold protein YncE
MKTIFLIILLLQGFLLTINAQELETVWETGPMLKTPESVFYDSALDQIYVSNINGKPTDKDGNGFISLVNTDGSIKVLQWITGMDAPKGLALEGNLLYVTDIDRIHVIDITTSKIINTILVPGASFLNDMVLMSPSSFVISDMGNNQLLQFDGERSRVMLEGGLLSAPNGLATSNGKLYVGTKENLLVYLPERNELEIFIPNTGSIDGLIPIGSDRFIISDWSGKISLISKNQIETLQNTADINIQAADLGYIPAQKLILVPTFFNNRLIAKQLPF